MSYFRNRSAIKDFFDYPITIAKVYVNEQPVTMLAQGDFLITKEQAIEIIKALQNFYSNECPNDAIKKYNDELTQKFSGDYNEPNPTVNQANPYHQKRPGYVYVVKGPNGAYKIGRTIDIKNRIKMFGVKLPFDVELEHVIESDDYMQAEITLQSKYQHKHINGEWYALTDNDIDAIRQIERL